MIWLYMHRMCWVVSYARLCSSRYVYLQKKRQYKNEVSAHILNFGVRAGMNGFGLYFSWPSGVFYYSQKYSNFTGMPININNLNCVNGKWHHVAFMFCPSVSKYLCYFNGVFHYSFTEYTVVNTLRTNCSIGKSLWLTDFFRVYH